MRLFVLGLVVAMVAASLLAWMAIVSGAIPVNADSAPPPLEKWAARTALISSVERRLTKGKNPATGAADVVDGIRIYRDNCEACHGNANGRAQAFAGGLYQKPPQFAKEGVQDIPYAYTSWVIRHGIRFTAMPAFSASLSQRQIEDVALFLHTMNHLTSGERFAWTGAPLRSDLRVAYAAIGGFRNCEYFPAPSVRPHRFVSETSVTRDGSFVVEHFYNRGISEYAVIGVDSRQGRLVRTRLAKDGTADIAVSPIRSGAIVWRSISDRGGTTTVTPRGDGSYAFRSSSAPGLGRCEARNP